MKCNGSLGSTHHPQGAIAKVLVFGAQAGEAHGIVHEPWGCDSGDAGQLRRGARFARRVARRECRVRYDVAEGRVEGDVALLPHWEEEGEGGGRRVEVLERHHLPPVAVHNSDAQRRALERDGTGYGGRVKGDDIAEQRDVAHAELLQCWVFKC